MANDLAKVAIDLEDVQADEMSGRLARDLGSYTVYIFIYTRKEQLVFRRKCFSVSSDDALSSTSQ